MRGETERVELRRARPKLIDVFTCSFFQPTTDSGLSSTVQLTRQLSAMKFNSLLAVLALACSVSPNDAAAAPQDGLLTPDQQAQVTTGGDKFEYQVSEIRRQKGEGEGEDES